MSGKHRRRCSRQSRVQVCGRGYPTLMGLCHLGSMRLRSEELLSHIYIGQCCLRKLGRPAIRTHSLGMGKGRLHIPPKEVFPQRTLEGSLRRKIEFCCHFHRTAHFLDAVCMQEGRLHHYQNFRLPTMTCSWSRLTRDFGLRVPLSVW